MKDSGVGWIGEIPESWELVKIGQHFKQRNEKVSDLDFNPLSVTKNGIVPQLDNAAKSSNHNDRKLVKKGDFVINSRSDRKQSSGIAYEDGSVSLINLVIKSRTVDTNFTNYLLKNAGFAEEFYRWGNGIVADLWSTKWDSMKRIPIPLPELAEQKKIANVIRDKVKIIDTIISETQQSIDELKKYKQALITETVTKGLDKNVEMKDSGIEWIGKIPSSWKIGRLKNLINQPLMYGANESGELFNPEWPRYIRITDIQENNSLSSENILSLEPTLASPYILKKGDVLFARSGATVGKTYYIDETSAGGAFAGYLIKASFNNALVGEFVYYYTLSYSYQKWKESIVIQATIQNIGADKYSNMPLPIPDIAEMKILVEKVSRIDRRISKIIEEKKKMIKTMLNYKQSLIYEYVTGKKEA